MREGEGDEQHAHCGRQSKVRCMRITLGGGFEHCFDFLNNCLFVLCKRFADEKSKSLSSSIDPRSPRVQGCVERDLVSEGF